MEWCGCRDAECEVHKGKAECFNPGAVRLYRVDMENTGGTLFCGGCADDALASGLFTDDGIDAATRAYLACALWSSTDDNDDSYDEKFQVSNFCADAVDAAKADVKSFKEQAGTLTAGLTDSDIGHDLWLTRNRHGAGFWGRGHEHGDALTSIVDGFGERHIFINEDGRLDIE